MTKKSTIFLTFAICADMHAQFSQAQSHILIVCSIKLTTACIAITVTTSFTLAI